MIDEIKLIVGLDPIEISLFSRITNNEVTHFVCPMYINKSSFDYERLGNDLSSVDATLCYVALDCSKGIDGFKLKRIIDSYSNSCQVIFYLKNPASYMQDIFKYKVLYEGMSTLKCEDIWPCYRDKYESIYAAFGNVILYKNIDNSLCLINDLCSILAISSDNVSIAEHKEISLEALTLAFINNININANENRMEEELEVLLTDYFLNIEGEKFSFSEEFILNAFSTYNQDINWLEMISGASINPIVPDSSNSIGSESDIYGAAQNVTMQMLSTSIPINDNNNLSKVIDAVERLSIISSKGIRTYDLSVYFEKYISLQSIPNINDLNTATEILECFNKVMRKDDNLKDNISKSIRLSKKL